MGIVTLSLYLTGVHLYGQRDAETGLEGPVGLKPGIIIVARDRRASTMDCVREQKEKFR